MSKVISFEKFVALNSAGVDARVAQASDKVVQLHSTGEDFSATVKRRASDGVQRGY